MNHSASHPAPPFALNAWWLALALCLLTAWPALAQHRARHLGHPSTRFAPPLTEPQQLRHLLTNEVMRADVAAILQQADWPGELEDFRRAAATAEIRQVKLPKGTRLPFMSARKDGQPIALIDVLWVGDEPIDAYEFFFASAGRRYRCVTPKACSNFLVIDLGPDLPALSLVMAVPPDVSRCAPFPVRLTVRNTSTLPLTGVRVRQALPEGWRTTDGQTGLELELGALRPGGGKEVNFQVQPAAPGTFSARAEAASAEGASAAASATTVVRAPVLALECQPPTDVLMRRPAQVCLVVHNTGDAPDSGATLTLPVPPGAVLTGVSVGGEVADGQVVWRLPALPPGGSERVCAVFTLAQPGTLSFTATARGACASPAEARCLAPVAGVPGVLVQLVDLEDPILVGEPVTYAIKITNQGPIPLTNGRVVCTVPDQQEFTSGDGATAVRVEGRTVTMDVLPVLAPGAVAEWRVVTRAMQTGDARFRVAFSSEQFPQPIEEDESTTQF